LTTDPGLAYFCCGDKNMTNTCPSREVLTSFALGRLPADVLEPMGDHLEECADCQAELETCDDAADTVLSQLRHCVLDEEFLDEPGYAEAMARIAAVGREPSVASQRILQAVPDAAPNLGMVGPYRLLMKLGAGGMGTVYKALHTKLKRVVALKLLPVERTQDTQAVTRFEREMEAVGRLSHPHIVLAHDAGEVDGRHFLVMEYVEGLDLSDLVRRHGPLSVPNACEIIRQAAAGLQHAHENGLVHRDIKPSNLMLTPEGTVKLLDLGLALLPEADNNNGSELTSTGQAMGTLDYMAPEQAGDSHEVDIRADIYSLGATLYKLLTGTAIHSGPDYKTAIQKWKALALEEATPLDERCPEAPAELSSFVQQMIAKDKDDRPAEPAEVAELLGGFTAGCDTAALLADWEPEPMPEVSTPVSQSTSTFHRLSSAFTDTEQHRRGSARPDVRAATPHTQPAAGWGRSIIIGLLLLLAGGGSVGLWQLIIRIRDNDGNERVIEVAEGSNVVVEQQAARTPADAAAEQPTEDDSQLLVSTHRIDPKRLDSTAPVSKYALVSHPARIPGVAGWTVETKLPRGVIRNMELSPDGQYLAYVSDGAVRIHEFEELKFVRAFMRPDLRDLAWLPDSKSLATIEGRGNGNSLVRIWQVADGRQLRQIEVAGTVRGMTEADFAPRISCSAKGLLAVADNSLSVPIFDIKTGEQVKELRHPTLINALGWSPTGDRLATQSGAWSSHRCYLWSSLDADSPHDLDMDMRTGGGNGLDNGLYRFVWSADGEHLALGLKSKVAFYEASSGQRLKTVASEGGEERTNVVTAPGPGPAFVCFTGESRQVVYLSDEKNKSSVPMPFNPSSMVIHPESGRILTTDRYGNVRLQAYNAREMLERDALTAERRRLNAPAGYHRRPRNAVWTPSCTRIATDGTFQCDPRYLRREWFQSVRSRLGLNDRRANDWHGLSVLKNGVEISKIVSEGRTSGPTRFDLSGTYVGTVCEDSVTRIWKIATGELVGEYSSGQPEMPNFTAFFANGRFVEVSAKRIVTVSKADFSGVETTVKAIAGGHGVLAALSPDSRRLAVGGSAGIRIFDESLQPIGRTIATRLYDGGFANRGLEWRNESTLAVYTADRNVELIDVETGRTVHSFAFPWGTFPFYQPPKNFGHTGRFFVSDDWGCYRQLDTFTGYVEAMVFYGGADYLHVGMTGHYDATPAVENQLFYLVDLEDGTQLNLAPKEFAQRFNWKNDSKRLRQDYVVRAKSLIENGYRPKDDVQAKPFVHDPPTLPDITKWKLGTPVNLGPGVNGPRRERHPTLSADELILVFTSERSGYLDLWMSTRSTQDESFGKAVTLGPRINSRNHDTGPALSADGLTLFFVSTRDNAEVNGPGRLYVTTRERVDADFGTPRLVEFAGEPSVGCRGPFISADGLELWFSRWNDGPQLYRVRRKTPNGEFAAPEPIGTQQNINNDFGSTDSSALSSDGRVLLTSGAGQYALLRENSEEPFRVFQKLRYESPLPTGAQEPHLSYDGKRVYFSSDKLEDKWDLWMAPILIDEQ
jgi:serine/threonine protein kinase/WD40 repeat protein